MILTPDRPCVQASFALDDELSIDGERKPKSVTVYRLCSGELVVNAFKYANEHGLPIIISAGDWPISHGGGWTIDF